MLLLSMIRGEEIEVEIIMSNGRSRDELKMQSEEVWKGAFSLL